MATLKIKNMVCDRCIMSVRDVLEDLGFRVESVSLGEASIAENPDEEDLSKVAKKLRGKGFELIREQKEALIEQIKGQLIEYVRLLESGDQPPKLSEYLSEKLHHNYSYLSNRFSGAEESTIENYLILLKIERVKELLTYEEMTLSEIAWKLNYSSVQYLSNQFKKVTGETVSSFRKHMNSGSRQSLDTIQ
ncbi:MAG TPA: helix-turn-helix domain-containing protein [Balneolaceae bacterium]|nr:helix-turn-helix domain-containing protein [Balneolaceae bacterium]